MRPDGASTGDRQTVNEPAAFPAALLLATALTLPAAAQEDAAGQSDPAPEPCSAPEHRQFDFWLGEWEVTGADGEPAGTNRIEAILGGCVLQESWSGQSEGRSVNIYSPADGRWHQTWVSDRGAHLQLAGGLDESGRMVMRGEAPKREGDGTVLHEISWQPLPDGTVRQHWRASEDGGETWRDLFVGTYRRIDG